MTDEEATKEPFTTIWIPECLRLELESLKKIPREPYYEVIKRLLRNQRKRTLD